MNCFNALSCLAAATLAGAACSRSGSGGAAGPEPLASGTIHNGAGERIGVATLADTAGQLQLAISVAQLTPGLHGLHFHAQGTCTPPAFASAGSTTFPYVVRAERIRRATMRSLCTPSGFAARTPAS